MQISDTVNHLKSWTVTAIHFEIKYVGSQMVFLNELWKKNNNFLQVFYTFIILLLIRCYTEKITKKQKSDRPPQPKNNLDTSSYHLLSATRKVIFAQKE